MPELLVTNILHRVSCNIFPSQMVHWTFLVFWLVLCVSGQEKNAIFPVRMRRDDTKQNGSEADNLRGRIEKGYYVEVLVGTPPQLLNILIDTGSSNFAIASNSREFVSTYYDSKKSTSVVDMGIPDIDIEYTEGFWKGHLVKDIVKIPTANLTKSSKVSIAEITDSKQFFINESGWQGILGMAYTALAKPNNGLVKSFMRSIVEDTGMDDIFSLKLCMADVHNHSDHVSGTFIIGGYDRATESIYWTRIIREWYYDVLILGMKVANFTIEVECSAYNNDKAIIDSGTTNLRLPTKIFGAVVEKIQRHIKSILSSNKTYGEFWQGKDVLCWDRNDDPYSLFPTLMIYLPSTLSNHTIELSVHPEHYILLSEPDGKKSCYKFGISPSDTGTVLGAVLMEEYTVIFDRKNKAIGFATSDCSPTSSLQHTIGYPNTTTCVYSTRQGPTNMQIAVYVLLGILLLCMLPVCILACAWCRRRAKRSDVNDTDYLLSNPVPSQ